MVLPAQVVLRAYPRVIQALARARTSTPQSCCRLPLVDTNDPLDKMTQSTGLKTDKPSALQQHVSFWDRKKRGVMCVLTTRRPAVWAHPSLLISKPHCFQLPDRFLRWVPRSRVQRVYQRHVRCRVPRLACRLPNAEVMDP